MRDDSGQQMPREVSSNPYAHWEERYPGHRAFGYLCTYAPLEVLHATGFAPVRLLSLSSSVSRANAYLPGFCCALARGVTERMLTGELRFLQGVLFAHGHKFGGHSLYIKDGKLKYVYNFLGENEQMITSNVNVPTGKCVLGVEFVKEKYVAIRNSPVPNQCIGTATLYINDKKVGELKGMTTQLGKFALCGEGLNIGREGGAPVTYDYPGEQPWAFTGGVLKRVIVDVSGELYVNFELEAAAMMSRD